MPKDDFNRRRRAKLKRGECGFCPNQRGLLRFLCDECASIHRERQRLNAMEKGGGTNPALFALDNEDAGSTLDRWWKLNIGVRK